MPAVMTPTHPRYVTDSRGRRKAVILPIKEYDELLEDLRDLALVAERRQETSIPHEQLLAELKRDGCLAH